MRNVNFLCMRPNTTYYLEINPNFHEKFRENLDNIFFAENYKKEKCAVKKELGYLVLTKIFVLSF